MFKIWLVSSYQHDVPWCSEIPDSELYLNVATFTTAKSCGPWNNASFGHAASRRHRRPCRRIQVPSSPQSPLVLFGASVSIISATWFCRATAVCLSHKSLLSLQSPFHSPRNGCRCTGCQQPFNNQNSRSVAGRKDQESVHFSESTIIYTCPYMS